MILYFALLLERYLNPTSGDMRYESPVFWVYKSPSGTAKGAFTTTNKNLPHSRHCDPPEAERGPGLLKTKSETFCFISPMFPATTKDSGLRMRKFPFLQIGFSRGRVILHCEREHLLQCWLYCPRNEKEIRRRELSSVPKIKPLGI